MLALRQSLLAYDTWLYKVRFDAMVVSGDQDELVHDVLDLGSTGPCIGVSSLFSFDNRSAHDGDGHVRVCLTVLPTAENRTFALFSYLTSDGPTVKNRLRSLFESEQDEQRYRLSRLVLEMSENITFNPKLVSSWSVKRRNLIRDFFKATILEPADPWFEDARLNLFDLKLSANDA